jgi:hypothetical protein
MLFYGAKPNRFLRILFLTIRGTLSLRFFPFWFGPQAIQILEFISIYILYNKYYVTLQFNSQAKYFFRCFNLLVLLYSLKPLASQLIYVLDSMVFLIVYKEKMYHFTSCKSTT